MRIWDLPPYVLDDKRLLGEHVESHAIATFLTTDKGGSYKKHPETLRWWGKEAALKIRHDLVVDEMHRRGFRHQSDMKFIVNSSAIQDTLVDSIEDQINLLIQKQGGLCAF